MILAKRPPRSSAFGREDVEERRRQIDLGDLRDERLASSMAVLIATDLIARIPTMDLLTTLNDNSKFFLAGPHLRH